jgi:hypothetical protein
MRKPLTLAEKIKRTIEKVKVWQTFKYVKHLVCPRENCGCKMIAKEMRGRVILQCPRCKTIQSYVPKSILKTQLVVFKKD